MRMFCMTLVLCLFVGTGEVIAKDRDKNFSNIEVMGELAETSLPILSSEYCGPYFRVMSDPFYGKFVTFHVKEVQALPVLSLVFVYPGKYILGFDDTAMSFRREEIRWIADPGATVPYATYGEKKGFKVIEIRMSLETFLDAPCLLPRPLKT